MQALVVFTGGTSGEAVISRKSAAMVMANIDRTRFAPTLVHINEDGWFAEVNGEMAPTDLQRLQACLLYTSPSPRDLSTSRMPSSA